MAGGRGGEEPAGSGSKRRLEYSPGHNSPPGGRERGNPTGPGNPARGPQKSGFVQDVSSDDEEVPSRCVDAQPPEKSKHRRLQAENARKREMLRKEETKDAYKFVAEFVYGKDRTLAPVLSSQNKNDLNGATHTQMVFCAMDFWKGNTNPSGSPSRKGCGDEVVRMAAAMAVSRMGVLHDQSPQDRATTWMQCIITAMVYNDMFGNTREVRQTVEHCMSV